MDLDALAVAGSIFILRVLGNMIITLRLVMLMRGQRLITAGLGALESLIFALALGSVVQNLGDILNLTAYCVGFSVGGYLGIELERRLVRRYVAVRVISPRNAHDIAEAVRAKGYGATESWGQGAQGVVGSVTIVIDHKETRDVIRTVGKVDEDAFITIEELRGISHGYFRRLIRHDR